MGSLFFLFKNRKATISWTPDRDDEVEAIIEKKMAAGCTFFIVQTNGLRQKLGKAIDAMKHRTLAIPDEDWRSFVGDHQDDGTVALLPPAAKPGKTIKRAKTAREVATNDTVGMKPRRGG